MSTPLPALVITTVEYLRSPHDPAQVVYSYLVPNIVFGHGLTRVQSVEDALEIIFRQCNRVDGSEYISTEDFRVAYPGIVRSLSVGDVVRMVGSGGFRACYVCEGVGWKQISVEDANWLVKHISPRDFWFSFEETKNRAGQHEWYPGTEEDFAKDTLRNYKGKPMSNTVEDKLSDELGYDSHAHLRDEEDGE